MAKSLCGRCHEVFKSVAGFDMHRIGDYEKGIYAAEDIHRKKPIARTPHTRRCMTSEEMLATGMARNDKGWWITSAYESSAHEDES